MKAIVATVCNFLQYEKLHKTTIVIEVLRSRSTHHTMFLKYKHIKTKPRIPKKLSQ